MSFSRAIAFMWTAQDPADDESTLVQVMAWCRQDTKPWPEPMITRIHDTIWQQ